MQRAGWFYSKTNNSFLSLALSLVFLMTSSLSFAQTLPAYPGSVSLTATYQPPVLLGLTVDPQRPLLFDFIVTSGDDDLNDSQMRQQGLDLVKYFMASLAVPEDDLWVNLSPYESDRIITPEFSQTRMGRDLLAQDYLLKQLSSSLMHPEGELGQKFWGRIYQRLREKYGRTDTSIDTFHKIWIMPDKAVVYEDQGKVLIGETRLKVMLEQDLVASLNANQRAAMGLDGAQEAVSEEVTRAFRNEILPVIEQEVNEGKTFKQLRQIYQSVVLAAWFKKRLHQHILRQVYIDQKKMSGIDDVPPQVSEEIYQAYLKTYQEGVYNFIAEEYDEVSKEIIPRQYFSGGSRLDTGAVFDVRPMGDDKDEAVLGDSTKKTARLRVAFKAVSPELAADDLQKRYHLDEKELMILEWLLKQEVKSRDGITQIASEVQILPGKIQAWGFSSVTELNQFFTERFGMSLTQSTVEGGARFGGFADMDTTTILKNSGVSQLARELIQDAVKNLSKPQRASVNHLLAGLWYGKRHSAVVPVDTTGNGQDYEELLEVSGREVQGALKGALEGLESARAEYFQVLGGDPSSKKKIKVLLNNATETGGGVAEMRTDTVRILQALESGASVDAQWSVIDGAVEFYDATVHIHEALHDGTYSDLSDEERLKLQIAWIMNFERFEREHSGKDLTGDVLWIDDPQPVGLIPLVRALYPGMIVSWRIHVDTSRPTRSIADYLSDIASGRLDQERDALLYAYLARRSVGGGESLKQQIQQGRLGADVAEFHKMEFAAGMFGVTEEALRQNDNTVNGIKIKEMGASVNPLGVKNRKLSQDFIRASRQWLKDLYNVPQDAEIVLEVSRFDPFKGPFEVITAMRLVLQALKDKADGGDAEARKRVDKIHFVYAGNAAGDNPKGAALLEAMRDFVKEIKEPWIRDRIHIVELQDADGKISFNSKQKQALADMGEKPQWIEELSGKSINALIVNAIQTSAATVVQFSRREGFGLVVTEALLKAGYYSENPTVVVATDVGGIATQVLGGEEQNGLLVHYGDDDKTFSSEIYRDLDSRGVKPDFQDIANRWVVQGFSDAIVESLLMPLEKKQSLAQRAYGHVVKNFTTIANITNIVQAMTAGTENKTQKEENWKKESAGGAAVEGGTTDGAQAAPPGGILLDPEFIHYTVHGAGAQVEGGIAAWPQFDIRPEQIQGFQPVVVDMTWMTRNQVLSSF